MTATDGVNGEKCYPIDQIVGKKCLLNDSLCIDVIETVEKCGPEAKEEYIKQGYEKLARAAANALDNILNGFGSESGSEVKEKDYDPFDNVIY